jgi:CheY-like chemotaxis protein
LATILVVDDEPNNRLLVKAVAEYAGHVVLEAASGERALAIALSESLDLVLLDLSLPAMGGPEFVRRLRANERTHALPVLLYTATQEDPALRDFMSIYSVSGFVSKPAEAHEVLSAIQRVLPD